MRRMRFKGGVLRDLKARKICTILSNRLSAMRMRIELFKRKWIITVPNQQESIVVDVWPVLCDVGRSLEPRRQHKGERVCAGKEKERKKNERKEKKKRGKEHKKKKKN